MGRLSIHRPVHSSAGYEFVINKQAKRLLVFLSEGRLRESEDERKLELEPIKINFDEDEKLEKIVKNVIKQFALLNLQLKTLPKGPEVIKDTDRMLELFLENDDSCHELYT
jgi:hypothetical protein